MFSCPVSRVVWGVIAICFHQKTRPASYDQFWGWIERALTGGDLVYTFGLAAYVLKKKVFKNPAEILYTSCAFMRYWAGLLRGHVEGDRRGSGAGVTNRGQAAGQEGKASRSGSGSGD
jgi:hypothetical protein